MNQHSSKATTKLFTTEARRRSPLCSLHFIALVLIVIGFFGPWVAHKTASLTMTGYELSEFTKFFPQVQGGTTPVKRALFVTPLLTAIISIALVVNRSAKSLLFRLSATALIALLGLVALPPLQAIFEPGYRTQLILVAGSVLLTLLTPLARQLSDQVRGALLLLLALMGLVPALWQATMLHPLIVELYRQPIWPGWGVITCAIGFLMLLFAGLRRIARP